MGWKYKAGLFLIATVVVIWVVSAEVTQVIPNFLFGDFFIFYFMILYGLKRFGFDIWLKTLFIVMY